MAFLVFLAIVLIVGGIVAIQKSRVIPSTYQNDYEAPYSDTPLPRERPYDYEKDGE